MLYPLTAGNEMATFWRHITSVWLKYVNIMETLVVVRFA